MDEDALRPDTVMLIVNARVEKGNGGYWIQFQKNVIAGRVPSQVAGRLCNDTIKEFATDSRR